MAPVKPATITSTAVKGAIPLIESLTCIATGVVNDLGKAVSKKALLAPKSSSRAAILIIPAKELWNDIQNLIDENEALCNSTPKYILDIDIESYRNKINIILKQVCTSIIKCFKNSDNKRLTDFLGRSFKKRDMSGLDLSMKLLIATNFDSCTFDGTVFLGADTRDTDFSNADLRESVFLSQGQINSAKGNRNTKLPKHLDYPVTWK